MSGQVEVDHGDLCVLSGIAHEIEYAEETRIWDGPPRDHISLSNAGAEHEPLARYHPDGVHPRAVCNRLASAGLLAKSRGRYGIEWRITPEGEAMLDELADELPRLRCRGHYPRDGAPYEYCTNEALGLRLPDVPCRFSFRLLVGRCEDCARASLEVDIENAAAKVEKEAENLREAIAYRDSVLKILDARTDREREKARL